MPYEVSALLLLGQLQLIETAIYLEMPGFAPSATKEQRMNGMFYWSMKCTRVSDRRTVSVLIQ